MWAGHSDLLLINRIEPTWWDVTFEVRVQRDWLFSCAFSSFPVFTLMGASCRMNCPLERRLWQGRQGQPPANSQWQLRPSGRQPVSHWILLTTTRMSFRSLRWDESWPMLWLQPYERPWSRGTYYRLNYIPPNSYVEALIPKVTVFRDRTYKEVIKVKWGCKGGTLL